MPAFHVHRSNRLERLVDALAEVVSGPRSSMGGADFPLDPEIIVVPSKGLERYLAMELAARLGVWAAPAFPFPRTFVEGALSEALGGPLATGMPSASDLGWTIAARLPGLLATPAFAPLARYLEGDHDGTKLLALANRIARVFDQYPVFRPDVVLAWERGEDAGAGDDAWQARLWREVFPPARGEISHVARRAEALSQALRRGTPLGELPPRVSVVGAPGLPPIYLDVLNALSSRMDVHLFVVSPSREHWAEIRSRREIARALRRHGDHAEHEGHDPRSEEDLLLSEGNPLLASFGRVGRDGQFSLESRVDYVEAGDRYVDARMGTALGVLQSDVLALRHRRAGNAEAPPLPLAPDDRSLELHACHGPMREIEVLRDRLLGMLDDDATLTPRDVVVMMPDVERYAPFVEAVFGVEPTEPTYLPYRIADRGMRAASEVASAFFAVLSVATGRFGQSEVLDLLGHAAVRARFGIAENEVEKLREWLSEVGIRWGVDAAHRAAVGQPPTHETTWRFGLDRLLLGWTMPGHDRERFGGALPFDDVEGDQAVLAGRLAELLETLVSLGDRLRQPHDVPTFVTLLGEVMSRTLDAEGPRALEHETLRRGLLGLASSATRAGFTGEVPLAPLIARLEELADEAAPAHGFLAGGLTFCALLPLRSIPFRVVCLVGMNDDAFPRSARSPSFDLLTAKPRRGDRSMRDDDRYLFLEAVLSARDRLLVTYVGQTAKEGTVVPPSVVVGELCDILTESFFVEGDARPEAVRERVLTRHPMQPFSPRYFRDGGEDGLFSYARVHAEGARALSSPRHPVPPLFTTALQPEPAPAVITLDDLSRFFAAPLGALLRDRLALSLGADAEVVDDREPLALEGLDRYRVGTDLVSLSLSLDGGGASLAEALPLVRAGGRLPLGTPGERAFDEISRRAETFASAVRPHVASGRREPLGVDVPLSPMGAEGRREALRVTGFLREVYAGAQVQVRYAKVKAAAELRLWIHHLALLLTRGAGDPAVSMLVQRSNAGPEITRFGSVDDPHRELSSLVELYLLGRHQPLPFFAQSSRALAAALNEGKSDEDAARSAHGAFTASVGASYLESADPYVARVLRGRSPFAPEFRLVPGGLTTFELARRVWLPVLAARKRAEGEAA